MATPRVRLLSSVCLALALSTLGVAQTADFYVSPDGNNNWSGTLPAPNATETDGPFATVPGAKQAVRNILQNPQGRTTPIVVMVRQGTYFQSRPLAFTTDDSGTSSLQVIWQNYPGETPVASGGIRIRNWVNQGGHLWTATLDSSIQYFEQLFYNNKRMLRPRLGTLGNGNNVGTYYRVAATVYLNSPGPPNPSPDPNCGVYVTGKGWECFDRFQYNPSDPISAAWQNLAPLTGNPCGQPAGNPALLGDIELYDFEYFSVPKLRIDCIDAANQIIYLTGATQQDATYNGFIPGHRYLVENVKDALTQEGQWFLDRSSSPWTLTYFASEGQNPNTDTVIVPQASQVLIGSGLQWVTFQGLTFAHDNFTVPFAGYHSPRDDTSMTGAVACLNCQNVTFDSDIITQTSGGGIELYPTKTSTTSADNIFQNGAIYDIGGFGIRVGHLATPADTDANVAQFTTIQNNVIEAFGRVFPASIGVMQGSGHDNTYTHNTIYDGYHSAIEICAFGCPPGTDNSQGTFNNIVSFNHAYDVMQGITSDGGAIYMSTGTPTFAASGNQILNNKIHDVVDASALDSDGYGGEGIYLDANTAMVNAENNLVYRISDAASWQTCGPQSPGIANTIKNNILAFARHSFQGEGCAAPGAGISQFNFSNNLVYYGGTAAPQSGCFYCAGGNCPAIANYAQNLYCDASNANCSLPTTPFFVSNISCSKTPVSFSSWQALGEDGGSVVADPLFVDPYYPADNFNLQSNSPAGMVGFVAFDLNAPGRTNVAIQAPKIPQTFATATMPVQTSTAVSSNLNPSAYGQAVEFTATVSSAIGPPPDGQPITFVADGTQTLGTGTLSKGTATFTTSSLVASNHYIKATFAGVPPWNASNSIPIEQTVNRAPSTAVVTANLNPSSYNQAVTLTATVSSSAGTPTGSVEFTENSQAIGTQTLNGGVATLTTSTLKTGTQTITAMYKGDQDFLPATSGSLNQVVTPASTQTTVTALPNPASAGAIIVLTATVTANGGTPIGKVAFNSDGKVLGSATVFGGKAVLKVTLKTGTHTITAQYPGNSDYTSSSGSVQEVVN